jgi:hypothetical protein
LTLAIQMPRRQVCGPLYVIVVEGVGGRRRGGCGLAAQAEFRLVVAGRVGCRSGTKLRVRGQVVVAEAGHDGFMRVELLVVPDCPNESGAMSVLRSAFERVGLTGQTVRTTVIVSGEQAQERGCVGSPTILIDGVDPFDVPGQEPAVACRVYLTPEGLVGVPPLGEVVTALAAARDRDRGPGSPD